MLLTGRCPVAEVQDSLLSTAGSAVGNVSASKLSFVFLDKEVIETMSVEFSKRMGNLDETFKSVRSGTLEKVAGIGTVSNMPDDLEFLVVTSSIPSGETCFR